MLRDLFLCQLVFKICFHLCEDLFKCPRFLPKMITRFDPAEKVQHRIGREKFPEIDRYHQDDRIFLLKSCHFLVDRLDHRRREQHRHRYPQFPRPLQHFRYRQDPLPHLQRSIFLPRFFQLIRSLFLLPRFLCILCIVFYKSVIFLILYRHVLRPEFDVRKPVVFVRQIQIIFHQLPQKFRCSGPVGQHMEHFKIDPLLIICHFKQQALFIPDIKTAARFFILLPHFRMQAAHFQITPEQPFPYHRQKHRICLHRLIQRFLQDLLFYLFL
ncbi:unknown [Lachnospiraceae bacterium CAG:215]|nr:unknown [Lachnospiraceae bacterium CAG:215]